MAKKIKPELWIQYSWVYDLTIHKWQGREFKECTSSALKYRQALQKKWDKIERKIFDTMSNVSGLEWQKPVIDCYVVQRTIPFSIPLTIPMHPDLDDQLEVISHELAHNLVVQNIEKIKRYRSAKYGKLSRTAQIHVLIHAILKEVYLQVFGEKKTLEIIKTYDELSSDYKKAWEIVEKEGAKNIIKECIKK